jgi:hypothetical protein
VHHLFQAAFIFLSAKPEKIEKSREIIHLFQILRFSNGPAWQRPDAPFCITSTPELVPLRSKA